MNKDRRRFLRTSAFLGTGILAETTVAAQHEHHGQAQAKAPKKEAPQHSQMKGPKLAGPAENVLVTAPDLSKLPWKMENGVKVFHLTAEVVKREFLPASEMGPAKVVDVWGYSGSMPGPTIE